MEVGVPGSLIQGPGSGMQCPGECNSGPQPLSNRKVKQIERWNSRSWGREFRIPGMEFRVQGMEIKVPGHVKTGNQLHPVDLLFFSSLNFLLPLRI
jgi:hypothetical protein